jgi:hypothetical protein
MDKAHLELGMAMVSAYSGALYGMDLLAWGALNRSRAHISGFESLVRAKNLICAGALLRLQLDTALRFYAAFLVDEPHAFALAVLDGQQIRRMKAKDNRSMTDAYLVQKLGAEYAWVPSVYERTSGYVHLSSTHLMSALTPKGEEDGNFKFDMKMSAEDKAFPQELYIEAVDAFCASTDILLTYVHGWVYTKANPEIVAELKAQRDAQKP